MQQSNFLKKMFSNFFALLLQTEKAYISEDSYSEAFCSFSADSTKSSARFVSLFWKNFNDSLLFVVADGSLESPWLSLGSTPGIFSPLPQPNVEEGMKGNRNLQLGYSCWSTQKTVAFC